MKLKTTRAVMWGLLALFCVCMLLMAWTRSVFFGYAAIAAVLVYAIVDRIFWRCPHCGACIGILWPGEYRYCRHCGKEIKL